MTNCTESDRLKFAETLITALPILSQRLATRYGDPQLAEEVSWECLTHAYEIWHHNPNYFEKRDLTTWTSTRAVWRAIDRLRERNRFSPLFEEHPGCDDENPFLGPLVEPREDEAELLQDRERTWACLNQLDEEDRLILTRYYYDGLTDQEIGTALYGEEGTEQARGLRVWRRRQKAHERLRTLLVKSGIDPADYAPLACQAV